MRRLHPALLEPFAIENVLIRLWLRCVCLLALSLLPGISPAWAAAPVITQFESRADLAPDGLLTVTETITANMPGGGHGLFRDVPYAIQLPSGQVVEIPPTVLEATLDGQPLKVTDTEQQAGNVLRMYLRDTDTTLAEGFHVFTVTYAMQHMVGFFEGHDELNWNVTGTLWSVPIERATYALTLPKGAVVEKVVAWEGVPGSREPAGDSSRSEDGSGQVTVRFVSLRTLEPGEGLTCAVSWNKGVVTEAEPPAAFMPPSAEMAACAEMAALGLALLVWAYCCMAWWRYGKDPAKGVTVPLFYAPVAPASFGLPKGTPLSPAAVNYLMNATTLEARGLSAMLLSLVCRETCVISGDADAGFSITATNGTGAVTPYPEEKTALTRIAATKSLPLGKAGADAIAEIMMETEKSLGSHSPNLWTFNAQWTLGGAVLALAGIAGCLLILFGLPDQWDAVKEEAIGSLGMVLGALPFVACIVLLLVRQGQWVLGLGIVVVACVIGYLVYDAVVGSLDLVSMSPLFVTGLAGALLAPCFFGGIMKAPTVAARKLMDGCEGLALYIKTAESDRFRQLNPPERTPELYSRLLPYAVALNLEKAWGENCASVLEQAQQRDTDTRYSVEHNLYAVGTAAVVSGTAQGMAAYEASQSSATGSDGGGSGSGGGGGGGGFC